MTHVLRVTDGSTTISMNTGDMYISEYTPQVATDFTQPLKETAKIRFYRTNASIRSNLNILNRLFQQAQSYDRNRTGARVYVEFDPGDTGNVYRSLLYGGRAKPGRNMLGWEWNDSNVEMELEWTRQPFWEGPLTQIPLTNAAGTDNTSGLAITNSCYSNTGGSTENWVSIDAADLIGDLPASVKIQMLNSKNGADPSDEIYIFHNVKSTPASFPHILEGESASGATVTSTSDGTCSDGYKGVLDWTTDTETLLAEWTLSAANLGYAAGGKFALLARWAGLFPYDDCWVRMKLETTTNYYPVWTGGLNLVSTIASGRELKLLDTVRLPPYLEGQSAVKELALRLYALIGHTSNQISLDYLQLSPISGEAGWLRFKSVARGVPYNQTFVYDGTEELTYYLDGSSNKISEFSRYGGPILLVPNENQKLYFNSSDYNGYAKVDQTWTVKAWYRPRRNVI